MTAKGFSLLELIIAMTVLVVAVAFSIPAFSNSGQEERFIQQAARRVRERRGAAIRLNPLAAGTSIENYTQPPLLIDFANSQSTAVLVLDGPPGAAVTQYDQASSSWTYVYEGMPLSPPPGWRLAGSAAELSPITPISGGRGAFATAVGFGCDGTPTPGPPLPSGPGEAPFWSLYFTNGKEARAIAAHATGDVEVWRWDSDSLVWKGFQGRSWVKMRGQCL